MDKELLQMAMLDEEGERYRCDRCHSEYEYSDEVHDIRAFWDFDVFFGIGKPVLPDFCYGCAKKVTPLVYALRDVVELKSFVNKLERAINDNKRRTKNNRPTANDACECCERCLKR